MIKKVLKSTARRSIVRAKKIAIAVPIIRKVGVRVKAVLFPGMMANREIYNYGKYYPTIPEYLTQLKGSAFRHNPVISLVLPTYNTPDVYLRECLDSVLLQSYKDWELCIADDASSDKSVMQTIREYTKKDKRIKFVERKVNGHISEATNSAISIATGEFIALLDHDDVLWPNALYEVVRAINENPKADLLYSDEDKIDSEGTNHAYPFFKPDWSPEFLESCNYITHFACIRTSVVKDVGGFRKGYEGAQDWDLFIRIGEVTSNIIHIPKMLYSWRIHEASTASNTDSKPYVYNAQTKLLNDHVDRCGQKATLKRGIIKQHASIEYAVVGDPRVSVVVIADNPATFRRNVLAIKKYNTYANLEVVLVSMTSGMRGYCERAARALQNGVVVDARGSSMAQAYNRAQAAASGDFLVFIESSLALNTKHWVELLLGDAQRDKVGVVSGRVADQQKLRYMRGGSAAGIYGLYAPLLEGIMLDDMHFIRGLYGQSRHNVSIIDGCFMVRRATLKHVGGFNEAMDDLFVGDFCLELLRAGYRNIYNPFVETVDSVNKTAGDGDMKRDKNAAQKFSKKWQEYIDNDPYFNPNFTRTNARMEIK